MFVTCQTYTETLSYAQAFFMHFFWPPSAASARSIESLHLTLIKQMIPARFVRRQLPSLYQLPHAHWRYP